MVEARAAGSRQLESAGIPWEPWVHQFFPHVTTAPFAPRHIRLWNWFDGLTPGLRPRPLVEAWPRGGGKSSSGELGCSRVCAKLSRRFVLYISGVQEQADKHVASVATLLESLGVERAVNIYGTSKGWKRQELRTANGFNLSGYGLDTGLRGVKLDNWRPDLLIFDDIDAQDDSARTIDKKIDAITTAIIPAGSSDCAVLVLQNLIHEESIVSRLVDGRADFLHDREISEPEPAVVGLETRLETQPDGSNIYRIVAGTATWAGQSLATCEKQINDMGLRAFKREAQHEVSGADGYVFQVSQLRTVAPAEVPELTSVCLAWDLAATEGGGNWTVGFLMGKAANGRFYVLAVIRGQWSSDRVRLCIRLTTAHFKALYPKLRLRLPQDPGQAGKAQAGQMANQLSDFSPVIKTVTGAKSTRAEGFAECVNKGNVSLVEENLPEFLSHYHLASDLLYGSWHRILRTELRQFREDVSDQTDDQVDSGSDSFNDLAKPVRVLSVA